MKLIEQIIEIGFGKTVSTCESTHPEIKADVEKRAQQILTLMVNEAERRIEGLESGNGYSVPWVCGHDRAKEEAIEAIRGMIDE